METGIVKTESGIVKQTEFIECLLSGECSTAEDIADKFDMPLLSVVKILNDKEFISTLTNYSKAKANLTFHTRGIAKLIDLVDSEDSKDSISAIKMLAQYTGNVKGTSADVNVNLDLNKLIESMDSKEKRVTPIDIPKL